MAFWIVALATACSLNRSGLGSAPDAGVTAPTDGATSADATALDGGGTRADATALDADSTDADLEIVDGGPAPGRLPTLRWELACVPGTYDRHLCDTDHTAEISGRMRGEPAVVYDVTLHVRGVVEEKSYRMGTADGRFYVGGEPIDDDWETAGLEVSDPPQTYYLNVGRSGYDWCIPLDYEATVPIATDATVRSWGYSRNSVSNRNQDMAGAPIVIAGAPPYPGWFDGHFVQIDMVSAVPR